MVVIQILLILAVVALLISFLRHHGKSRTAAGVKIGFALFMVFGVIAVLVPSATSWLAQAVGVGRGTDLLLYGTVVAFGFATINTYLRFKELEHRYAKLVRAIAVQNGERPEDRPTGS